MLTYWISLIFLSLILITIYTLYLSYCTIISGFAAGTYYTSKGGGVNYQCMPLDPEYGECKRGARYCGISGVEYETSGSSLDSVANHNFPCARCYTHRSAIMMIPGKRSCPGEWKVEYEGKFPINL